MRKYAGKLLLALTLGPPVLGQTPSSQQPVPVAPDKNVPAFAEAKAPPPPPPPPAPKVAPETLPPLPQEIRIKLVQDPPVQPLQAAPAPAQPQAFTISVTPAAPAVAAPAPTVVQAVPTTTAVQAVSYTHTPGPLSMLFGNIGESMALAKRTRVVTYLPNTPVQVQAIQAAPVVVSAPVTTVQAIQAPVQAVTATPQTAIVRRHCFQWFQP